MKSKHRRALKTKDLNRLQELALKHPSELTPEEQAEMQKLIKLQEKYGNI